MGEKIYIFGYLSLLSKESMFGTLDNKEVITIPLKLQGFTRTWNSERISTKETFKKYVLMDGLSPVDRFCWATLEPKEDGWVNGLVLQVDKVGLDNMDSREVGYKRVDVSDKVVSYEGFGDMDGCKVYTYIAKNSLSNKKSYIDINYVNMGYLGAKEIDKYCVGFLRDYISTTSTCCSEISNLYQIFMSYDGRAIYMLNTKDSSVIKIHEFKNIIYKARQDSDPYEYQTICGPWSCRDIRNIENGVGGIHSSAYSSVDKQLLSELEKKNDQWLDMCLLRNKSLNYTELSQVLKRLNWVGQLIAYDLGYIKGDGCEYWADGFKKLHQLI